MAPQEITSGRLVIDASADRRNGTIIEQWRARFGAEAVRICKNHAKLARDWNDRFRLLLRGSMNLNFNPRFEQLDITGPFDFSEELLPMEEFRRLALETRPDLKAAFVFYGPAPAAQDIAKIQCPVYGFYAQNDARINTSIPAADKAMTCGPVRLGR